MKKYKKIGVYLLAICLIFALTACNDSEADEFTSLRSFEYHFIPEEYEEEYSEYEKVITLEADTDMEASHEIVARAQKLYRNVLRLDVQLNFVMASKEPLNPNDVAEAARLAGFTQLNPMRYFLGSVKHIAEATIFLTQDDFDRKYLTIALDAPLAQPDSNPLRTLFSVANDLCARLNLQLQDSRDRPINTESAQSINSQLKKYYDEMYAADIEPGSARARVLFTRD